MLSERDSHLGIAELLLFWKFQKRKGWNLSSHHLIIPVPPEMLSVYNAFPYGAKTDNSLAVKILYCVMEEADAFCWVVHFFLWNFCRDDGFFNMFCPGGSVPISNICKIQTGVSAVGNKIPSPTSVFYCTESWQETRCWQPPIYCTQRSVTTPPVSILPP